MPTDTAGGIMAKRNDVSTKIDEDVLKTCRLAADFKGIPLAQYLSESMRPIAERDVDRGYAEWKKPPETEAGQVKPKPKGRKPKGDT